MEQIVNLIIPFIALAILSVMIDKFTLFLEGIMNKLPHFPDKFEWWSAYAVVLIFSTVICWQGDFRFFDYLNLYFPMWLDYLMTGLVISGGSAFVRTQFSMIDAIPASVIGITASFKRMLPGKEKAADNESIKNINDMTIQPYYPIATETYPVDTYPVATEETVDYDNSNRYSDDI